MPVHILEPYDQVDTSKEAYLTCLRIPACLWEAPHMGLLLIMIRVRRMSNRVDSPRSNLRMSFFDDILDGDTIVP